MKRFWSMAGCIAALALALPAWAAPARYAVSASSVAAAIDGFGIQVAPDQVMLLSDVVASIPNPQLQVRSMQRWGDHRMMVRLECAASDQCLPFIVGVRLNRQPEEQPIAASSPRSGIAAPIPEPLPASMPLPSGVPARSMAVHANAPATLYLDGDHVHIRLTVICLQNGAPGQTVRATDKDHKVVYSAEVVQTGVLRGKL